ncbi:putative DNA-binding domain-containing protein [Dokdonia ponticola]|uniref:DNA-binding domain-containing protein n=1 Tax=Dokdonia ponticola TaxID=2041041 RepID=A0ABV9HS01_9FLAO
MEKEKIPLAHFQQWMQQLLLDPFQQTGVNPSKLLPDVYRQLEDVIHDSEKLSAREHLGIYQRSYIARLRHCMSQQFSALAYALGDDIFCAFADEYLALRPSYNYNLALLGKHFPEYLETNRPDKDAPQKEDWINFVIELAQFEYDLGVIFEQKAEETYQLATIDTPVEKLRLVPICELFSFDFPVRRFYSGFKNGKEPDLPFEQKTYTVVLRHNYKLAVYDLHKEQFEFLKYVKESTTVGEAIKKFKENRPEEATQFDRVWNTWKTRWIGVNLFRIS